MTTTKSQKSRCCPRHSCRTRTCILAAAAIVGLGCTDQGPGATQVTVAQVEEGRVEAERVELRVRGLERGLAVPLTDVVAARAVDEAGDTIILAARCMPARVDTFTTVQGTAYRAFALNGLLRVGPVLVTGAEASLPGGAP